jgi:hypothetical protein
VPLDPAGEVARPGRQRGDQVNGLEPGAVVVDGLPFERCVIDDALHDEFAAGACGEQPEQLVHLGDLADSGQLDDVAFDGGQHVVPKPAGPLPGGEPVHFRVAPVQARSSRSRRLNRAGW